MIMQGQKIGQLTREEAINYLHGMKLLLAQPASWEIQKQRLAEAGRTVGYKPAFRCLVMDVEPEKAVRWTE